MPTALITGSSRGIGAATAELLAGRGYDVVIHYRRDEGAAQQVAALVTAQGQRALVARAELADEEEVRSLVAQAVDRFGTLDVLVANAASSAFKPLAEFRRHHLQLTFDTIVGSFVTLMQTAEPHLADGGRVVTVSGFDTVEVLNNHALLAAAKAALETLTRYWAVEWAARSITVNSLIPGYVETDSARIYAETSHPGGWDGARAEWAARTPAGRLATPLDIARIIALLCSADAAWITGQLIIADGGITLTHL
ncbi:MAG: SDR family oxidoreductase [Acidimicrobiales bacterium]